MHKKKDVYVLQMGLSLQKGRGGEVERTLEGEGRQLVFGKGGRCKKKKKGKRKRKGVGGGGGKKDLCHGAAKGVGEVGISGASLAYIRGGKWGSTNLKRKRIFY